MMNPFARITLEISSWGLAGVWIARAYSATRHMPSIPDLSTVRWNRSHTRMPGITVVVPARDEALHIAATLKSLVAQDYSALCVVPVNDRSTDETGAIIEDFAERYPRRVEPVHITSLPEGWLGKTNAMNAAVGTHRTEYILFTDADVTFDPSILRRTLAFMEHENAAHVVVAPTPVIESVGEGIMLGFFQVLGIFAVRPWCIASPKAKDAIGVGAFNLVRRDALEKIGGLEPQRLTVIEDAALGFRIKSAGLSQRLVTAPGMVQVHWAAGARGIIRVMTKNLFSTVNFNPVALMAVCLGITLLFLGPIAGLFWWPTVVPSVLAVLAIAMAYRAMQSMTSIPAGYAWTYPAGALAFIWAALRSMLAVWVRRGVVWRGTHYSLRELRKHNNLRKWRKPVSKAA
jgi:glycosyltransferase involved in cell wall biosynthesis